MPNKSSPAPAEETDAPAPEKTSSGKPEPTSAPPSPEKELNPNTGVTNTPNPALPPDADVGTLEQPKNTGTGDTPAPQTPGSAPGPVDRDGNPYETRDTLGTGPYPKGTDLPTQKELPETPSEA